MKIEQSNDQLVIDNSLVGKIIVAIILVVVGIGLVIYGLMKHQNVALGIGAAFVAAGALFVVFSRSTHIVLSKSGTSTVASKTLFGNATSEQFALSDVSSVLLSTSEIHGNVKQGDGSVREQTKINANIFLLTKTAQRIHLGGLSQVVNVGGVVGAIIESLPLRAEAMKIATFIGVPLQFSDAVGVNSFGS